MALVFNVRSIYTIIPSNDHLPRSLCIEHEILWINTILYLNFADSCLGLLLQITNDCGVYKQSYNYNFLDSVNEFDIFFLIFVGVIILDIFTRIDPYYPTYISQSWPSRRFVQVLFLMLSE